MHTIPFKDAVLNKSNEFGRPSTPSSGGLRSGKEHSLRDPLAEVEL